MLNNKELMTKYYQNDDYIKVINKLSKELLENYNNGELISVKTYQEKYEWFPLEYNKEKQKYIFNKEQVKKFTKLYNEDMFQEDYYIKFYIDSQNKNLRIISKDLDDEIAIYIPDIGSLIIENLEYFNKIRDNFYQNFPVNDEICK